MKLIVIPDLTNKNECIRTRFIIHQDYNGINEPELEGTIDWQDGILIGHSEGIEPHDWSEISALVSEAITRSKEMIGDVVWTAGGQR